MKNVILTVRFTVTDKNIAAEISRKLIEERLIACANISTVDSLYIWEGKLQEEPEAEVICKTTIPLHSRVEERITQLHPYDLPGILVYPVEANEAYANWVSEVVLSPGV